MLIDCHAHQFTPGMLDRHEFWGPRYEAQGLTVGHWQLKRKNSPVRTAEENRGRIADLFSLSNRLASMDKAGVDKLILSVPSHVFMYWAGDFGDEYAAICNDELSAFCRQAPDRLDFWCHANLANPQAAVREIDRAVRQLGAKGLAVGGANFGGIEAHDERLFPVWQKLTELDVPVMVHGYNQSIWWGEKWEDDKFDTTSIVGDCVDETLYFWYLINGGALDVFPTLKTYINHAGGFVPFQLARFDTLNATMAVDSRNKRRLIDYMDNFYFDLDVSTPLLRQAVVDIVGVDRLLYGTNFAGEYGFGDLTEGAGLTPAQCMKVRSTNAIELLKLDVAVPVTA